MFESTFNLRYFEMNKFGEASPLTMVTLLEEAASDHCAHIDHGLFDLYSQNIGWVLISIYMQIDRYPKFREKITIKTWMSKYTTTRGYRENLILDEQGTVIGKARGLWVFYNTVKKRPQRIFNSILQRWQPYGNEYVPYDIDADISPSGQVIYEKDFEVFQYDLDANHHVNNLRYMQWALETVPSNFYNQAYLHTMNVRFVKEAYFGQPIRAITLTAGDNNIFYHKIANADTGELFVKANCEWKERVAVVKPKLYRFA